MGFQVNRDDGGGHHDQGGGLFGDRYTSVPLG